MSPIGKKNLLADIEELKKSPWFNADYISDERRLGMKEALDMMGSIIRNTPTMDAIPVEWIKKYMSRCLAIEQDAIGEMVKEWTERKEE